MKRLTIKRAMLLTLALLGISIPPTGKPEAAQKASEPRAEEITEVILRRNPGLNPLLGMRHLSDIRLRRPEAPGELRRFDLLGRWLIAQKFFDLQDRYNKDGNPDGPSLKITVVTGKKSKFVFNGHGSGDEATWAFEMMITGVSADLDRYKKERDFLDSLRQNPPSRVP